MDAESSEDFLRFTMMNFSTENFFQQLSIADIKQNINSKIETPNTPQLAKNLNFEKIKQIVSTKSNN